MTLKERFPSLFEQPYSGDWLTEKELLGLAPNTLSAYGYALVDYLQFCEIHAINPTNARRTDIVAYVNDLKTRPKSSQHARPARNTYPLRSIAHEGFANATIRLRLATVRLYYEYLIDEEVRAKNPVKKGIYRRYGWGRRGLVARHEKHPWIPDETQWQALLKAASTEPIRNRFMLALAYDAGYFYKKAT